MQYCYIPHPMYERVRDHLEQAIAILPRDTAADRLRGMIDEAIDVTIELAYLRPNASNLRVMSLQGGRNRMKH